MEVNILSARKSGLSILTRYRRRTTGPAKMLQTKSTIVALTLTVILSISFESNNAAPAPTQTDSTPLTYAHDSSILPESIDEEVLELEQLKHPPPQPSGGANTKEEILPQLEKQLEEEAQASASITSSDENADGEDDDDDNDDDNDTGGDTNADDSDDDEGNSDYAEKLAKASESMLLKTLTEYHNQQRQELLAAQHQHHLPGAGGDGNNKLESADENMKLMKLLPGAARLTFGQRYSADSTTTVAPTTMKAIPRSQPEEVPDNEQDERSRTNNGHRRGDNAEVLLRHSGGQYSAFDMSQYVFWTGDEAGVARAVEELIQKGLMTRENAIKFLRDIRLGIDYLQNTYSSHPLKSTERHSNTESGIEATTMESITTEAPTTITTHTESVVGSSIIGQQATPEILKVIERLPSLLKLNELGEQTDSTQDYDDVVGRLRLADFLYAEYSLEEVIYQLAKVMFTQSLTRGSEPAQHALQKLTEFLETEGNHGRISPVLQKKILDVLLAALADTLAENPELLNAARSSLGKHMDKILQKIPRDSH